MTLRLSEEQARKMGIPILDSKQKNKRNSSKRQIITSYLQKIQRAQCTIIPQRRGLLIHIEGIGIPSLNAMLGWNQKTEAYSYKKAWDKFVEVLKKETDVTLYEPTGKKYTFEFDGVDVKEIECA